MLQGISPRGTHPFHRLPFHYGRVGPVHHPFPDSPLHRPKPAQFPALWRPPAHPAHPADLHPSIVYAVASAGGLPAGAAPPSSAGSPPSSGGGGDNPGGKKRGGLGGLLDRMLGRGGQLELPFAEVHLADLKARTLRRVDLARVGQVATALGMPFDDFWTQFIAHERAVKGAAIGIDGLYPIETADARKDLAARAADWLELFVILAPVTVGIAPFLPWFGLDRMFRLLRHIEWQDGKKRLMEAVVRLATVHLPTGPVIQWLGPDRLLAFVSAFSTPAHASEALRTVAELADGDSSAPSFFALTSPDTVILTAQRLRQSAPQFLARWGDTLRILDQWMVTVEAAQPDQSASGRISASGAPGAASSASGRKVLKEFSASAAALVAALPREFDGKAVEQVLSHLTGVERHHALSRAVARQMVMAGLLDQVKEGAAHLAFMGKQAKSLRATLAVAGSAEQFLERGRRLLEDGGTEVAGFRHLTDPATVAKILNALHTDESVFWDLFGRQCSHTLANVASRQNPTQAAAEWLKIFAAAADAQVGATPFLEWFGIHRMLALVDYLQWQPEGPHMLKFLVLLAGAPHEEKPLGQRLGPDALLKIVRGFVSRADAHLYLKSLADIAVGQRLEPEFFTDAVPDPGVLIQCAQRLQGFAPRFLQEWARTFRTLNRWILKQQERAPVADKQLAAMREIPEWFSLSARDAIERCLADYDAKDAQKALHKLAQRLRPEALARALARQLVMSDMLVAEQERNHAVLLVSLAAKDGTGQFFSQLIQALHLAWHQTAFKRAVDRYGLLPTTIPPVPPDPGAL